MKRLEATDKQQEIINKSKELRREYNRQYYQKNKEKIRNNQNQYWERKASEMLKEESKKHAD